MVHYLSALHTFNGGEIPDPAVFTDEALDYYERRLEITINPIVRSWYADFLWVKRPNHVFARRAIEAYHECFPICMEKEWWEEAADSLVRALRLALSINDRSLTELAKSKILSQRQSHPHVRYCLDLVDALLEIGKGDIEDQDVETALEVCQAGAEFYRSDQGGHNYRIAREFLSRTAVILTHLKREEEAAVARVSIGAFWEAEAELKGHASSLVGAMFLQDAAAHYANIGRSDKVEELKIKVREGYQAAIDRGEFKPVEAEATIPVKDIEAEARELLKQGLDQALLNLSLSPSWVPDIDAARKRAQEKHAVKWGLLYTNVADAVDPPRIEPKVVRPPTIEEARMILDLSKSTPYFAPLTFMARTGVRRGECLGLRWSDVDLDHAIASITQSLQRIRGKGWSSHR